MAKTDQVNIIDSNGKQYRTHRSFAEKHCRAGNGVWKGSSVFAFHRVSQSPAATLSVEQPAPRRAWFHVRQRPTEPTVSTGGNAGATYLAYPFPEQGQRGARGLRERFPALAAEGAGLR